MTDTRKLRRLIGLGFSPTQSGCTQVEMTAQEMRVDGRKDGTGEGGGCSLAEAVVVKGWAGAEDEKGRAQ